MPTYISFSDATAGRFGKLRYFLRRGKRRISLQTFQTFVSWWRSLSVRGQRPALLGLNKTALQRSSQVTLGQWQHFATERSFPPAAGKYFSRHSKFSCSVQKDGSSGDLMISSFVLKVTASVSADPRHSFSFVFLCSNSCHVSVTKRSKTVFTSIHKIQTSKSDTAPYDKPLTRYGPVLLTLIVQNSRVI